MSKPLALDSEQDNRNWSALVHAIKPGDVFPVGLPLLTYGPVSEAEGDDFEEPPLKEGVVYLRDDKPK